MVKQCLMCGESFEGKTARATYCSAICRNEFYVKFLQHKKADNVFYIHPHVTLLNNWGRNGRQHCA